MPTGSPLVHFGQFPTADVDNWPQQYLLSNFYLYILEICCTCEIKAGIIFTWDSTTVTLLLA